MTKKLKQAAQASLTAPDLKDLPGSLISSKKTAAKKSATAKTANGKATANGKNTNGKPGIQHLDFPASEELDNRELLRVLYEVKEGNFSIRLPEDKLGISGKICETLNHIISLNEMLRDELTQAKNTIGKKGHLNHRVALPRYAKGSWAAGVDSINTLISDLVHPTIEIAHVISSVAK